MDIKELRTVAVERAQKLGDTTMLLELLRKNDLNNLEAEYLADLFEGKVKKKRGRKPDPATADKRIKAALIAFWGEHEDWKDDAIHKAIEDSVGVSRTMAIKYLKDPQTQEDAQWELFIRWTTVRGRNEERIKRLRARDLKPIP